MDSVRVSSDTCERSYSHKRNLARHIKKKHETCTDYMCRGRFIRRGYVAADHEKCHKHRKFRVYRLRKRTNKVQRPSSESF